MELKLSRIITLPRIIIMCALSILLTMGTIKQSTAFGPGDNVPADENFGSCDLQYGLSANAKTAFIQLGSSGNAYNPGGTFYGTGGAAQNSASGPITAAVIAGCLGVGTGDITALTQDGADSAFSTDTLMGFSFNLGTPASGVPQGLFERKIVDVRPSVAITGAPATTNGTTPFTVTFMFSEDVTGFEVADITAALVNATAGSFSGGPRTYTAQITPNGAGSVSIGVNAGAAQDSASQDNIATQTPVNVALVRTPSITLDPPLPAAGQTGVKAIVSFTAPLTPALTGAADIDVTGTGVQSGGDCAAAAVSTTTAYIFECEFVAGVAGTDNIMVTLNSLSDPNYQATGSAQFSVGKGTLTPASIALDPPSPAPGQTGVKAVITFGGPLTPPLAGAANITVSGSGVANNTSVNCTSAAVSGTSPYTYECLFDAGVAGTNNITVTLNSLSDPNYQATGSAQFSVGKGTLTPASIALDPPSPAPGQTGVKAVITFGGPLTPPLAGAASITVSGTGVANNMAVNCTAAAVSGTSPYTYECLFTAGVVGTNNITVALNSLSDTNYQATGSAQFSVGQVVTLTPAITLDPPSPTAGQTGVKAIITFNGTLTPPLAGTASITVSGTGVANNTAVNCTAAAVSGNNPYTFECLFTAGVVGTDNITVALNSLSDTNYQAAGSAQFSVGKGTLTTASITLDPPSPTPGQTGIKAIFTFTAPLTPPLDGTANITVSGTGVKNNTPVNCAAAGITGGSSATDPYKFECSFTAGVAGTDNITVELNSLSSTSYTATASALFSVVAGSAVARLTTQMAADYLGDRNAMLLANGVNMSNRLSRLRPGRNGGSGLSGGILSVNLGESEDASASAFSMNLRTSLPGDVRVTDDTVTFAASTARLARSGVFSADIYDGDGDIVADRMGDSPSTPQMRWDIWVEGRIARFDSSNNKDGKFGAIYVGADYLITPNMLIGLMTQYDWLKKDYDANGRVKGQGWMVGPYAGFRFGENLYLEAQARGGRSSNDITPLGTYTDKFKTTRWYFSGRLSGDFGYGDWMIRPGVAVQYLSEKQKAYTDSLGNHIRAQTVSEGDVRVGPRIAYTYGLGDGGAIIPWAEFEGVYTFGSKDKFSKGTYASDIHGLSGSVQAGFDWRMPVGAMFSLSGSYDGIGSDARSYGARARIDIAF